MDRRDEYRRWIDGKMNLWMNITIVYSIVLIIIPSTSLLQEVQTSEQCIKARSIAQAAGERALLDVGSASRWLSPPKQ